MNKKALHQLSYGVYVVTTLTKKNNKEVPTGCIVNSIMQITSNPATIAVSINQSNYTHSCISEGKLFAVSILSEKSNPEIIGTFGFQSGKNTNKFSEISYITKETLPIIESSCSYLICKCIKKVNVGTHTIFLGEIIDCDILSQEKPMTYSYYHSVLKGKSPKAAPTYIEKSTTQEPEISSENVKNKYVCSICGYVYEGENLPDDFVCPICKQPASAFNLQEK
ncbi:MAG: flavin reductase [Ruminococcus sp.]|nr:flavin reductase [Ruminococcus sp.]